MHARNAAQDSKTWRIFIVVISGRQAQSFDAKRVGGIYSGPNNSLRWNSRLGCGLYPHPGGACFCFIVSGSTREDTEKG